MIPPKKSLVIAIVRMTAELRDRVVAVTHWSGVRHLVLLIPMGLRSIFFFLLLANALASASAPAHHENQDDNDYKYHETHLYGVHASGIGQFAALYVGARSWLEGKMLPRKAFA
jgi:hypothetical protein